MSIDFIQLKPQISDLGSRMHQRSVLLGELIDTLHSSLNTYAAEQDVVQKNVQAVLRKNPHFRCALPSCEPLNACYPPPQIESQALIIGADGSQINPDRHRSVDYCLINIGAISMAHGTSRVPTEIVQSQLLYDQQMYMRGSRISESLVALRRDRLERELEC